jgi:hypothetical protein
MSRRLLQIINAILALMTIALAGASLIFGIESPIYGGSLSDIPVLDSNLRFFGGLGLGLGLALLWIIPTIERHGLVYRIIWICALLGGLGRLISMLDSGMPPMPMVIFTIIEVPGVPLLIYWQHRVARDYQLD